jgi:hypothetical protein
LDIFKGREHSEDLGVVSWEDNIKMDDKEIRWEGADWIYQTPNLRRWGRGLL